MDGSIFKILITKAAKADITILYAINHHRIKYLDSFFVLFCLATTYVSISLILTLLMNSIRRKSRQMRYKTGVLTAVFIASALTSLVLKNAIHRERPFVKYPYIEKLSEAGNASFPSGHTLEAFAMATAFSLLFPYKKIVVPIFLWACLVAYSRMALGVHYPSDVLGGISIGCSIGIMVYKILNHVWLNKRQAH